MTKENMAAENPTETKNNKKSMTNIVVGNKIRIEPLLLKIKNKIAGI